jgi:methionyl-tRNA formyltransferase
MRVVFLGTPEFAVPSLRALIESELEVAAVFTQPDRPSGRGQHLQPSPVKRCAVERGITVYQPEKIRTEDNRSILEALAPDFIAVVAYGQILPNWLLRVPRIAPVNVHGSLLPKYRGAAPVAWAIYNGETATGVTTMIIEQKLDSGPILLQKQVPIPETTTSGELAAELSRAGARLLVPTLRGLADGSLEPVVQDESLVTWAPRIAKEMASISWERPAREIHNHVRAFNPWPLAYTHFSGARLQIVRTLPAELGGAAPPGTILTYAGDAIVVQCGQGTALELLEVKPENRSRMTGREFANGSHLQSGQGFSTS